MHCCCLKVYAVPWVCHPNVQAVHKGPVAVTHVCSERDIVPPSTEQDTESHISTEMMTTTEAEVF